MNILKCIVVQPLKLIQDKDKDKDEDKDKDMDQ